MTTPCKPEQGGESRLQMSNQLKKRIMEKYIVLQKIGTFSPDFVRAFEDPSDAQGFVKLLRKSGNEFTKYFIAELREEEQS